MKSRRLACITTMTLLSALAIPVQLTAQNALGLKYTVLYTFTGGTDGAIPFGGLIQDEAGNLYGTTWVGGDLSACTGGTGTGCGVVFKVDSTGNETVLHSFTGPDGANSEAGLVRDTEGNLYGTTVDGGNAGFPAGTVFKLDPAGEETVLIDFIGANGIDPFAGLVRDDAGNLYGTAIAGGNLSTCGGEGCGVVFKVDPSGNETILYPFTGLDGAGPYGDLVRDSEGNLYGTTGGGGPSGAGVVFKVDPTDHETVLYAFTGGADGRGPLAGLVRDEAGNLYGTTYEGGLCEECGVVFKVDPTGKETVLYSFTGIGGVDGALPIGGLVRDSQGNLYGTTQAGGNQGSYCGGFCGVVFKVDPTGKETVLYTFTGLADGYGPVARLLRDNQGNLYGTAAYGGDLGSPQGWCAAQGPGCGVVFKISACHTATCRGGDDSDTATAPTNPAAVAQHPSTVTPASQTLRDHGMLDRLRARRFPGDRPAGPAIDQSN